MEPKQAAAIRALEEVEDDMLLGLGSGSTATYFIDALGERVRHGLRIAGVATSRSTQLQAEGYGIRLVESIEQDIDLTVDGADEVDPSLNLIKGRGGALLREKVVASASRRMMVIATEDKMVPHLGRGPLAVEILPLLWQHTAESVRALRVEPTVRRDGRALFVTDNGNYLLDCQFQPPRDMEALARELERIPGVIGHGLFLGIATEAAVAGPSGVRVIRPA